MIGLQLTDVYISGYPRYTADVHAQFKRIISSMNNDIGVKVATMNSFFHQVGLVMGMVSLGCNIIMFKIFRQTFQSERDLSEH